MKNSSFNLSFLSKILITGVACMFAATHSQQPSAFDTKQAGTVSVVYNKWFSGPLHYILTNSKWASVIAGIYANSTWSAANIPGFIKQYSLNTHEVKQPIGTFKTFNDFFKRELKPFARRIDPKKDSVVSPADGAILAFERIGLSDNFPVKGTKFNLKTFLKDDALAKEFEGGTAVIVRLAPWDYHRIHFPLTGVPTEPTVIHGKYESVHPFVYSCGIQPLQINERHLILLNTRAASKVALIPVGALFVGAIKETYTPDSNIKKGDEIGYFEFGGSTIVMLFKKDAINLDQRISYNSAKGIETPIKMGESIAYTTQKLLADNPLFETITID